MSTVADDIELIRDLIAWADSNAKRIADSIGVANTTINRFANGKATTRLGRETLDKLRAKYPEFPGFIDRPAANAAPFQMEGASAERMRSDLPVFGSALGADRRVDGEAVEQTTLNRAEVLFYAKRPVLLDGRSEAYGLVVSGHSMEPRHDHGSTLLVDPKARERVGDDVVVYLRPQSPDDDDGERARAVLVKRLVRRTSGYIELQQFTPPLVFRIPTVEVLRVDRVIPWSELLS